MIERGYREYVENEKKRYAAAIAGRDPKDIKKMIELLKLKGGETPLDATRRLVDEREQIEKVLSGAESGEGEIIANVERMGDELGTKRDDELNLRKTFSPESGENLADVAQRLVAKTHALQADLAGSQKKVGELEDKIGPLQRLAELVAKFLKAFMKKGPKLGTELVAMLREIGDLVGEKFQIKKEKPGKE